MVPSELDPDPFTSLYSRRTDRIDYEPSEDDTLTGIWTQFKEEIKHRNRFFISRLPRTRKTMRCLSGKTTREQWWVLIVKAHNP